MKNILNILVKNLYKKEGLTFQESLQLTSYKNSLNLPQNHSQVSGRVTRGDFQDQVALAVQSLKKDNVIAIPTDTIYGIAGLAQNSLAIKKIYNIKNRNTQKPIAICVSRIEDIPKWGKITIPRQLLQELLPGPVTLVFTRTADLNPQLNPENSSIGIRIPEHSFVQALNEACGEPLALTSANISDSQSTVEIKEFLDLWPKLDLIFDGGRLGKDVCSRLGSTVVDLTLEGYFRIIRPGSALQQTVDSLLKFGLEETVYNGELVQSYKIS